MSSAESRFEESLVGQTFVVTAELAPPHGVDVTRTLDLADRVGGLVHAFNLTDNQNARLHLAPMAMSRLMIERGHDVVCQFTCRDRNRLALQSDLLGAWALGVRNVLALTGDHVSLGNHPDAAPVFDLDSLQLLSVIKDLGHGRDMTGRALRGTPRFFAGAALACDQEPRRLALLRMRKKISAGAAFFQTQAVFHPAALQPFHREARAHGARVVAGVLLLHSPAVIEHINRRVPGLSIPPDVARRVASAADPVAAGILEVKRIVEACRPFCDGVHLMTAGRDDLLPRLVEGVLA